MPKIEFDDDEPLSGWIWGDFESFPTSGQIFREVSEAAGKLVLSEFKEAIASATIWLELSEDKKSVVVVMASACGDNEFAIKCDLTEAVDGSLDGADERPEMSAILKRLAGKLQK